MGYGRLAGGNGDDESEPETEAEETLTVEEESDDDEEEKYECDECGDTFDSQPALTGHMNVHSDDDEESDGEDE